MLFSRILRRVRSTIAGLFGVSNVRARDGTWWETDLLLVILIGSVILGVIAWMRL
jgi:hypothetical protein